MTDKNKTTIIVKSAEDTYEVVVVTKTDLGLELNPLYEGFCNFPGQYTLKEAKKHALHFNEPNPVMIDSTTRTGRIPVKELKKLILEQCFK